MYTKLKNILRCHASGMGIKETALTFHISRNTVRKYVRMFISSGKSTEQLLALSEEHLRELLGIKEFREREVSQRRMELEALIPEYVARLSRKGMTVRKLFNEYREEHPDGLQETTFKLAIRQYQVHSKVVGHVEHYAADQMYIDFAGDKLEVVDEVTGEIKKAEVFVAILPFSHYTYCEAVWSQKKEDLIKGCQNAFEYFEGVTAAIVPDNLKAAVARSDRNEPVINEEFAAFAEHYGCAVYPARVRHPKDKALVENAVKLLYRSVYIDIEGMVFSSLETLNATLHISLHDFNTKPMAGRDMSRKDMFIKGERDFLRPLPERRFVMKERKLMTVGKNCYVSLFKHHYSVPREYVGKRVALLFDADRVEIYCGLNLVTTHDRCDIPYAYSWKKEHNLPGHYGPYDKDLQELFDKAAQLDNIVYTYLLEVDRTMQYPPKSFSSCRGILSLEKKYGPDRLIAACACATQKSEYGYQAVRQVLEQGDDADFLPDEDGNAQSCCEQIKTPVHKNIRGREYYGQTNDQKKEKNYGNK
ncbi:MAG: IS21 family transposase [Muribaculaceae bacterium]|nr:IS21 family transposase [Muribaculaceae bacterium]